MNREVRFPKHFFECASTTPRNPSPLPRKSRYHVTCTTNWCVQIRINGQQEVSPLLHNAAYPFPPKAIPNPPHTFPPRSGSAQQSVSGMLADA